MSNWKAKLPLHSPPQGDAHAVLAYKTQGGFRQELSGTITLRRARLLERVMSADETELEETYRILDVSPTIRKRKKETTDGDK